MLVLSRRKGETISIGDGITITVVRVGNESVRIGIEAPRDVAILRDDIKETIRSHTYTVHPTCVNFRPSMVVQSTDSNQHQSREV